MNLKTSFLNVNLEKKIYMKEHESCLVMMITMFATSINFPSMTFEVLRYCYFIRLQNNIVFIFQLFKILILIISISEAIFIYFCAHKVYDN